jgi:hypothetical protein
MTASPEDPVEAPLDVQRVLMDRARRQAERHAERPARPLLPRLVGLGLAIVVAATLLFAFDRFLASVQRFLGLPVVAPAPAVTEPLPAYAVPAEPEVPAPAEQAGPTEAQ